MRRARRETGGTMAALHELSAIELARAIAGREVSSREALTHFVERVDRLDGPLNAVVTRDVEAAMAAAGMRTTSGAPALADHVPTEDAAPVAAVRRAGAVVWAKTNLPIYAGDMQSYNEVFGTT